MFGKSAVIDSNTAVINNTLEIELRKISNRLTLIGALLKCFLVKHFDNDPELLQAIKTLSENLTNAEAVKI